MQLSTGGSGKKTKTDKRHAKGRTYKGGGNKGKVNSFFGSIKKGVKKGVKAVKRTVKKVDKALDRPSDWDKALLGHKKSESKSKHKSSKSKTKPNVMSAHRAEEAIAGKKLPVKNGSSKTSSKHKASSKPKANTTHKSTSSTHKTTSSAKKDAVKRATGGSSKPKSGTAHKSPSSKPKTTHKTAPKSTAKKSPSKESQIKAGYKKGSDSYYNGQKSLLDSGRTTDLAGVNKAYNESMQSENKNKRDTQYAYDDRVGVINDDAYRQAQLTQLGAYDAGIQNSQQMLGLQAGDNFRRDTQVQGAMTERDRMLADINGRISTIVKQKGIDTNTINSNYNTNLRGARATADGMYYDKSSDFDSNQYTQDRQHAWDVEDRNAGYAHDIDMFNRQQKANKALAGSGGGGGGRSSAYGRASSGGGGSSRGTSGLNQQAKQYKQAKQTTPLGKYNNSFANKGQSVVVKNKYPLGAPPTVNDNPNLSAWQKMKMIGG